jgi:hypothetical protein
VGKIDNKQKYIDVRQIAKYVPAEYLHKINLLFNKDIPKTPSNANEVLIWQLANAKETNIQQHFHKETNLLACELKKLNKFNMLEFVQIDNGDTAGGSLSQIQRMVLYKRKKAEGSKKGFPDIMIPFYCSNLNYRDVVFCEVKKIAAPSSIHLTEEQLNWFITLNDMGFHSYITNNPIFFRDVILKEIKNYYIK